MRVTHYQTMNLPGTILEIKRIKTKQWMIGGTAQERLVAVVRLDRGDVIQYYASDLRIKE